MNELKHNKEVREGGGGGGGGGAQMSKSLTQKGRDHLGAWTAWPVIEKSILTSNYIESLCEVIRGHELGVCWRPQTHINTHSRGHRWWRIPGGRQERRPPVLKEGVK